MIVRNASPEEKDEIKLENHLPSCPISLELVNQLTWPVLGTDGYIYNLPHLEEWLNRSSNCPTRSAEAFPEVDSYIPMSPALNDLIACFNELKTKYLTEQKERYRLEDEYKKTLAANALKTNQLEMLNHQHGLLKELIREYETKLNNPDQSLQRQCDNLERKITKLELDLSIAKTQLEAQKLMTDSSDYFANHWKRRCEKLEKDNKELEKFKLFADNVKNMMPSLAPARVLTPATVATIPAATRPALPRRNFFSAPVMVSRDLSEPVIERNPRL